MYGSIGSHGMSTAVDIIAPILGIAAIAAAFSPLAAVSFMAFNLLSTPCMAAVAAANSELRSRKWMAFALCFWTVTAWVVSFLIFQVGTLLGLGG